MSSATHRTNSIFPTVNASNSVNVVDTLLSFLSQNTFIRNAAYQWDKTNLTHTMSRLYEGHLFQSPFSLQSDSHLLSIPSELRLIIYEWVFAPPYAEKSSEILALLSTCRLIHGEAIELALRNVEFRLHGDKGLILRSKLWSLGVLQQHLRHIEISMPLSEVDSIGPNNPFILTTLPLNILKINFGDIKCESWKSEVAYYHLFMSALLYRSKPKQPRDKTDPISKNLRLQSKRRIEIMTWQFTPTRQELYDVLLRMLAKKVVVQYKKTTEDILWYAFIHFGLVDSLLTIVETWTSQEHSSQVQEKYLMFGEEEGEAVSFFEMGRMTESARQRGPLT